MQHHVRRVVGTERPVNTHDIAMIEFRQRLRFFNETLKAPGVIAEQFAERGVAAPYVARAAKSAGKYSLMLTLRDNAISSARYVTPNPPAPRTRSIL